MSFIRHEAAIRSLIFFVKLYFRTITFTSERLNRFEQTDIMHTLFFYSRSLLQ